MPLSKNPDISRDNNGDIVIDHGKQQVTLELDWLLSRSKDDLNNLHKRGSHKHKRQMICGFITNFICKILRDHCDYEFKGHEV